MKTSVTTPHCPNSSIPFSASFFAGKHHSATTSSSFISFSFKSPPPPTPPGSGNSSNSSPPSGKLRRPKTFKTPPSSKPTPKTPSSNPLKSLLTSKNGAKDVYSVTNKLWLTSKLSPPPLPPPPPPPPPSSPPEEVKEIENEVEENLGPPRIEFRQEGKIFVGNLPSWVKKNEVTEFFRQFGPIKNVILIKGHDSTQRNAGFGFVLYGGSTAAKSAMKAVEFDGVEFHGRVLTVKLDDGKRSKEKTEERARWVQGYDNGGVNDYPSEWHEGREGELAEGLQEGFGDRARELAGGREGF